MKKFRRRERTLENINSHGEDEDVIDKDKDRDGGTDLSNGDVSKRCSNRAAECDEHVEGIETSLLFIISS